MQVLASANGSANTLDAVKAVTRTMGLSGYAPAADLEQAMLDVWSLSEAANASAAAA